MSRRSLLTAMGDTAGAVALAPPSRPVRRRLAGQGGIGAGALAHSKAGGG
jgi:hypothetical protein